MVMGWVYGEQSEKNGTSSKEEFASLLAKDRWCDDSSLEESFLLFSFAIVKDAQVVDVWEQYEESGWWNPRFSWQFHDWELKVVIDFFQKPLACSVMREDDDSLSERNPRVASSLLNPSTSLWSRVEVSYSPQALFGIPRFL